MTSATPERETSPDAVSDLWRRLRDDGEAAARTGLILHYSALVKYVAGRVGAGLPATVESQDLVSYGMFGLIDAVDRFQPERDVRFETYAATRIRGAIVDELRRLDWVPRRVRAKARHLAVSLEELEHRLERGATEEELAEHTGVSVAELRATLGDVAAGGVIALDDLAAGDDGVPMRDLLADPAALDPGDVVGRADQRARLLDTVRSLPERERQVVALYYFESMTLAQIGEVLGVTESRISQVHAKAVLSLRNRLVRAEREG